MSKRIKEVKKEKTKTIFETEEDVSFNVDCYIIDKMKKLLTLKGK